MVRYADLKRITWGGRRPGGPISVSRPTPFPFSRWGELYILPLQPAVFLIAIAVISRVGAVWRHLEPKKPCRIHLGVAKG